LFRDYNTRRAAPAMIAATLRSIERAGAALVALGLYVWTVGEEWPVAVPFALL
jgi:hypothetical protein